MAELSLRQRQSLFVKYLGKLIVYAYTQGYELTLGEGHVASKTGHMQNSLHYIRLAQDLNLFVGGKWMAKACPEWYKLGEYWERLDPLCRWGGRFESVDLNHFSIFYGGRA